MRGYWGKSKEAEEKNKLKLTPPCIHFPFSLLRTKHLPLSSAAQGALSQPQELISFLIICVTLTSYDYQDRMELKSKEAKEDDFITNFTFE